VKPRTLVVLALVVGALAAFIALYERELPGSDARREAEKKVFRVEAEDLLGLEIEWQGARVRLERPPRPQGADAPAFPPPREWQLLEPHAGRGDRTLADRLASDLAGLELVRALDEGDRAEAGLEPPRGRIRWRSSKGEGTLELGADVPASSNLVAAASGRTGFVVVPRAILSAIDRAPGDWRAKEVLAATREEIERVRLVPAGGAAEAVVLARRGEDFAVESPFADVADGDRVEPLLSDLTSLRVERFLDAPLAPEAEQGLASGPGRLELALRERTETFVVELGAEVAPESGRYVRAGGQAFVARSRLADALVRPPEDWRSRAWTSFDSWRIERLRVTDGEGTLELVREAGDWKRDGVRIPYTDVGDLLYALTSPRAERVLAGPEAAAVPVAAPELTLGLADADGAEETLTLHGPYDEGFAARVSGRDVVLLLPLKAAAEVQHKLAAVRAAKPVATNGEAVDAAGSAAEGSAPE
jgi:hypothetical protein